MFKYISTIFLIAAVLIFLSNTFVLATLPAATTPVVSGGVITSAGYNDILYAIGDTATTTASSIIYLLTNTNSNNITYSGKLTITSATTTNQTLTNFWSTNGQITNASTTYLTIGTTAFIGNLATTTMDLLTICTTRNGACIGGTNTQVQFNSGGVFAGSNNFTWNDGGQKLTATNGTFTNATSSSSFFIPNVSSSTISALGQIQIVTTQASTSLRFYDGTASRSLFDLQPRTVTIATSTLAGAVGTGGTSTIPLGAAIRAQTWANIICYTDTGTAGVKFGDGTNFMPYIPVTSTVTNTVVSTNNSFAYLKNIQILVGTLAGGVNYISCTVSYRQNAD